MWYCCEKCGIRERLWNSRPRVTPFLIPCRACDGEMKHVDWHLDEYDPYHYPEKGERIFVDCSREAAEQFHRKRIDQFWEHPDFSLKERFGTKAAALEVLMNEWKFGQPLLEEI
jgi:hypothetical protein